MAIKDQKQSSFNCIKTSFFHSFPFFFFLVNEMPLVQEQLENHYDSLYHLAQLSVYKLNNPTEKDPTLRRQLFVRNLFILSSNLITTTQEDVWLDACFDELDQDEDSVMEEDNLLVVAIPFHQPIRKSLFLL